MKAIKFLLAVVALVWGGNLYAQLEADYMDKPLNSADGKVKWYFMEIPGTTGLSGRVYTAEEKSVYARYKAVYSDFELRARQQWCFSTEDGEWYTIRNRYDGRYLGIGSGATNYDYLVMLDEPQAKFKINDVDKTAYGFWYLGLQTDTPAANDPNGKYIYVEASGDTECVIWLASGNTIFRHCFQPTLVEDTYEAIDSEYAYFAIENTDEEGEFEYIVDNTSLVDAEYRFTVEYGDHSNENAHWSIVESVPGQLSFVNRATGNSISTEFEPGDLYNLPLATAKGEAKGVWSVLPVSEFEYVFKTDCSDGVSRYLVAQSLRDDKPEFKTTGVAGTPYSWRFTRVGSEVGINDVAAAKPVGVRVENGCIIAPEGAKVSVYSTDGVRMSVGTRLPKGIYVVTVNGATTKVTVR